MRAPTPRPIGALCLIRQRATVRRSQTLRSLLNVAQASMPWCANSLIGRAIALKLGALRQYTRLSHDVGFEVFPLVMVG